MMKKYFSVVFLLLASCTSVIPSEVVTLTRSAMQSSPTSTNVAPTMTPISVGTYTLTPTQTISPTFLPTETVSFPLHSGSVIPDYLYAVISKNNLDSVTLLAQWPNQSWGDFVWSPNNSSLAFATQTGIYVKEVRG